MAETRNIKNEELEPTEKTGGDFFDTDKGSTSRGTEKPIGTESGIENETEEDFVDRGRSPTPFEISRTRYYDSEKEKTTQRLQYLMF